MRTERYAVILLAVGVAAFTLGAEVRCTQPAGAIDPWVLAPRPAFVGFTVGEHLGHAVVHLASDPRPLLGTIKTALGLVESGLAK